MKELFDLLVMVIVAKLMWKGFRFFTKKDKRHKKSIAGKISLLLSRWIHRKLDEMIVKQKENQQDNVIELKKIQRR